MASKAKSEIRNQNSGISEEEKIYKVEDIYKLKFRAEDGSIVMIRKAYKPRGKLEFFQPAE